MKKLSNAIVLTFDENKSYICNICSDEITENIIALKCEPTKHIFCYDCILEWYSILKKKKSSYTNNYSIITMCPVCRNNGGLLPCCYGEKIKGIHIIDKTQKEQSNIILEEKIDPASDILKNKTVCGYKLVSKVGNCQLKCNPKYGGFCKKHFTIKNKLNDINTGQNIDISNMNQNILTSNETLSNNNNNNKNLCVLINPNKEPHICGVKLTSNVGYCTNKGNKLYGDFCGIHKKYSKNNLLDHNVNSIININNDINNDINNETTYTVI